MKYILSLLFIVFSLNIFAQGTIKGRVTDPASGETIIGASVIHAPGKGTVTDIDGNFTLPLPNGDYTIAVSAPGYKTVSKQVKLNNNTVELSFTLASNTLREVEVVSDIAIARETPVAFSNIDPKKIQEQLGSQDLPMILNTTPGVYATQQGGGDGDARVSIRGFNSQNVQVLIDGIPMNDMFNGRVFWSNWFGLDNLTSGVQVQRGLGASKLSIPAIGGTMNILTAGIDSKKQLSIRQEIGNNFNARTGITYNSGKLNKGWGFSVAGSFRRNDGYVDQLTSRMFFYYFKVEKYVGKHLFSFSAFGGPQTTGQRDFTVDQPIYSYSKRMAASLGIDTVGKTEYGRRYNPSWNYVTRNRDNPNAEREVFNSSINQFHKPVISLKHFVNVNSKFYISNIIYASYGMGGGTGPNNTIPIDSTGRQNFQAIYTSNATSEFNIYPGFGPDSLYKGQRRAANFIRKNHNEHQWYGGLSQIKYEPNSHWDISAGIDLRTYNGQVFSRVHDLMGADLWVSSADLNAAPNSPVFVGDRMRQFIERKVRWTGAFALAEYKAGNWSAFLNVSSSASYYKQYNHFAKKEMVLADTTLLIGYNDTITYNGTFYDRNTPELRVNQSDWQTLIGYTVKAGVNYNLTEKMNIFMNIGNLNRAPLMQFVLRNDNKKFQGVKNEVIRSIEFGYGYRSSDFSLNLNGYYTNWNNRPTTVSFTVNGEPISSNAQGMSALHKGIELDFIYKINRKLTWEGAVSIGDWKWNSTATAFAIDDAGNVADTVKFDPRGVRVGDAAQRSYSTSFRYEPFKRFYFKPQFTWFTHNFANYSPDGLRITDLANGLGPNIGRQSWRMPDYGTLDLNMGYGFVFNKIKLDARLTVINALDAFGITDAQSNQFGTTSSFNAASSSVNFLLGRRWLGSITATF